MTDDATFNIIENGPADRFELHRDGEVVSVATYTERHGTVIIPHVTTRPEHRGQGFAARLMDGLLSQLRSSGRSVAPVCPFAVDHIAQNPQHQDLLANIHR
ncbi:MAG: GNAT family N-acetyltransferase [Acidimicrobiales bacterium]